MELSSSPIGHRHSAGRPTPSRSEFPNVTPSERRYFHYYTISKKLGVSGKKNRAKLPTCVTKKIAEMYPDVEGTPTKVGYQQDADGRS